MLHPLLKWAQRKEKVFVEVPLRDISNEQINLTGTSLKFKGKSDSTDYAFEIQLFEEVNPQDSKWTKTGFHLFFVLQKKDPSKPFWSRLVKSTVKNKDIQVDWNKWVDQDEEQEQGDKGLSGFDPSQMQNFGGMPGMGGMGGMGMPGMGGMGGMGMPGMGGMGGMGMPGMGGMGMPGMGGFGQDQQGNIDDLEGEQQIQEGQKKQGVETAEKAEQK